MESKVARRGGGGGERSVKGTLEDRKPLERKRYVWKDITELNLTEILWDGVHWVNLDKGQWQVVNTE
jgi:hypothetical protein